MLWITYIIVRETAKLFTEYETKSKEAAEA